MKTYALASIDSDVKLRTSIDRVGGQNPTWNDKFLFRVSREFLYSETSGISIEIFADGIFRDTLVGTVWLLVGNLLRTGSSYIPLRIPSFSAVQVHRPSGRFQGILNVGASVLFSSDVPAMYGFSAVNFRDMIEEAPKSKMVHRSYSNLGIRIPHQKQNPFIFLDNQPIKERTKHARSSSDSVIWGTGSAGIAPKNVYRSGPRFVVNNFNYEKKPVNVHVRSKPTS
ncbi:hypothetical protein V6N13_022026 [Hibiscus sabdariffa]|uniref:Uncharacterized protein n=2 Tax=Hibiscus sabdariffa TaxID=183260 RepID=A0ABR1ZIE6_9ROSI